MTQPSKELMELDMLVAELDYENRLLRARNERLQKELESAQSSAPVQEPVAERFEAMHANGDVWITTIAAAQIARNTTPPYVATPLAAQPAPVQPVGTVKDLFTQAAWERLDVCGSTKVYLDTTPAAPVQEEIQRLSALVRAQQITIEKLEAQRQFVGLADEQKRELVTDWFAEGWAIKAAHGMLDNYDTLMREKNTGEKK